METLMEGRSERLFLAAEDLFVALLCSFSSWYNRSGRAELHHRRSFNSSESPAEMFAQEWHGFIPPFHTRVLQVCPLVAFLAMLLATPPLLARILCRAHLRRQTRYLLLANVLLSDLLFVGLTLLSAGINLAGALMSEWPCAALLFLSGALYSSGILSISTMALDTCLAVLAPLRYPALWPLSRTYAAIAGIWLASVLVPAASIGLFLWYHSTGPCPLHICSLPLLMVLTVSHFRPLHVSILLTLSGVILVLMLVLCGYIVLCAEVSSHEHCLCGGVWKGEASARARGTFLIHFLHLFLLFCPLLVLVIELMLFLQSHSLDLRANLWVSLVTCNVLLVLPKGLAPYLYGLRYRELCTVLFQFFRLGRPVPITPVM